MGIAAKLRGRLKGGAVFVALGILLSRVAGLVRERVFAHYLGNSEAAGAFKAALRIPNFLQNLFGEGVLSASFIPVYARLLAENRPELAGRVAGVVGAVLATVVSLLVAIGVTLTPWFVDLVAPGFQGETRDLTIRLVRILFPGVGLLVLSAWCLGILNSHRRFFVSYVAPVLWNAAMIATLICFGSRSSQAELAVWVAWGSVVGSLLQLGVQVPFVLSCTRHVSPGFDLKLAQVRSVFVNLGPVLVSRGVVQVSAYIDGMIASFLGAGAVAGMAYAQTLYLLPISLFGMSVAAAELPEMAGAGAGAQGAAKLRERLVAGRRNIAFFVVPSVVGFVFLGRWVVAALYQTGQFGAEDTLYVWYLLIGSAGGLLAATYGRLYSSAFYALGDTRTPLLFAVIRVVLTAALGVAIAFPLRPLLIAGIEAAGLAIPRIPDAMLALGAVGLTLSSGLAGWIEFALLKRALSRRVGDTSIPARYRARLWAVALASAGAGLGVAAVIPGIVLVGYDLKPLVVIGVYGAAYLGVARALRAPGGSPGGTGGSHGGSQGA